MAAPVGEGTRIGEWELDALIGQGAFGAVWRAHHHAWDTRLAAVKLPSEPSRIGNLRREGKVVQELRHPNIVQSIAFDPWADPTPYLVMEFVAGGNLRAWISQKRVQPSDAVAVLKQVLTALEYAHALGVVHLDVKPENVLIDESVQTGGFTVGAVKLGDFGSGNLPSGVPGEIQLSGSLTKGAPAGTFDYMAPEQKEGGPVDGRTDLYACGVVFFEMLTGKRPAGPELPSELNSAVPKDLDAIYRRACARVPQRYQSAKDFLHALGNGNGAPGHAAASAKPAGGCSETPPGIDSASGEQERYAGVSEFRLSSEASELAARFRTELSEPVSRDVDEIRTRLTKEEQRIEHLIGAANETADKACRDGADLSKTSMERFNKLRQDLQEEKNWLPDLPGPPRAMSAPRPFAISDFPAARASLLASFDATAESLRAVASDGTRTVSPGLIVGCGIFVAAIILAWVSASGGWFWLLLLAQIPLALMVATYVDKTSVHRRVGKVLGALQSVEDFLASFLKLVQEHRRQALEQLAQNQTAARQAGKEQLEEARRRYAPRLDEMRRTLLAFHVRTESAGAAWSDPLWEAWAPDSSPEFGARLGMLNLPLGRLAELFAPVDLKLQLPAMIPFADGKCLLLSATGPAKDQATKSLQSVMFRMLANVPPAKMWFTLIDPVGLGQNVAGFIALGDHDKSLITSKAWSEPQHIEQRLADLTEHMEKVIQKYLRSEHADIQAYNRKANEVSEPFRCLVVFDFPANFTDASAKRLLSIIRNGPRCGVYTIIVADSAKPPPYGLVMKEFEDSATLVQSAPDTSRRATPADKKLSVGSVEGGFVWNAPETESCGLLLDQPPPDTLAKKIIEISGQQAKTALKVEVPYRKLLAMAGINAESWTKAKSTNELCVPLGRKGALEVCDLLLGKGLSVHALVVGRPGSGKSNLMHVVITTIALKYSPDEVQLYLIDLKGGVGFQPYAKSRLPHAAFIAIDNERDFSMSILDGIKKEMDRRFKLFKSVRDHDIDDIQNYREKTNLPLARLLLIVDEFQEFFREDDEMSQRAKMIFDQVVKQGRAAGIHLLLSTQSLSGTAMLPSSTLEQMAVRIALQCSEADSRLILARDNPAARLLSRPGEAIYNAQAGLVEGNQPFQVANFTDEDRSEHLSMIKGRAESRHVPTIFEGNQPAELSECMPLREALDAVEAPPSQSAPRIWLGKPIAILPALSATLSRQAGRHLLVVTRDEEQGVGLIFSAWISLAAQCRATTACFHVLDLCTAESPWAETAAQFREKFPQQCDILRRQSLLDFLTTSVETIKKQGRDGAQQGDIPAAKYLIILGLQRARDFRKEESFSYKGSTGGPNPSDLLATLLRDGPEAGMHVLAWCDTAANAARAVGRSMNDFGIRVAGPMSADESRQLLNDTAASRLDKPYRAFFSDEDRPGALQKFIPFGLPSAQWIDSAAASVSRKR